MDQGSFKRFKSSFIVVLMNKANDAENQTTPASTAER